MAPPTAMRAKSGMSRDMAKTATSPAPIKKRMTRKKPIPIFQHSQRIKIMNSMLNMVGYSFIQVNKLFSK